MIGRHLAPPALSVEPSLKSVGSLEDSWGRGELKLGSAGIDTLQQAMTASALPCPIAGAGFSTAISTKTSRPPNVATTIMSSVLGLGRDRAGFDRYLFLLVVMPQAWASRVPTPLPYPISKTNPTAPEPRSKRV